MLHDLPLMYLKLCRKHLETVGRNDPLGNLPFLFLPFRKIGLFVVTGLFRLTLKSVGDGFHMAGVSIQKGEGLIELHLQRIDDVVQANNRGHGFEIIILLWAPVGEQKSPQKIAGRKCDAFRVPGTSRLRPRRHFCR